MELIPPFAMYFTVCQALELDIGDQTALDLRSANDAAQPFVACQTRILYTLWQKLTDESRRDLIEAHDREYDYVSEPK